MRRLFPSFPDNCGSNIFLWNTDCTFIFKEFLTRYQLDLLYPYSSFLQKLPQIHEKQIPFSQDMLSPLLCIVFLLSTISIPILISTKLPNTGARFTDNLPAWPQKPSLDWYIIGLFKQMANQEQFLIFIPLEPLHEQHPAPVPCYQNIFFLWKAFSNWHFKQSQATIKHTNKIPTAALAKLTICSLRGAKAWERREYKVKG